MALQVLCSTLELEEDGEAIAVGDHISRLGSQSGNAFYGTELDSIGSHFDNEAEAEATGLAATTISGRVAAISAIYVQLTRRADQGWTARPGSAHLEALDPTAATRQVRPMIDWGPVSTPDEQGHAYSAGYPRTEEGDERLSGWLITFEPDQIDPPSGAAR